MKRKRKGMTIIELMVVIAIVTILASIVIPSISHALAVSKLRACMENIRLLSTAFEMYTNDNSGTYVFNNYIKDTALFPNYVSVNPTCPAATSTLNEYFIKANVYPSSQEVYIWCGNWNAHDDIMMQVTDYSMGGGPQWSCIQNEYVTAGGWQPEGVESVIE